jgi:hypothetical protein
MYHKNLNIGLPAPRAHKSIVNVFQVVREDQFYVRKVRTVQKQLNKLTETFGPHYYTVTYFKIVSELSSAFVWSKINHAPYLATVEQDSQHVFSFVVLVPSVLSGCIVVIMLLRNLQSQRVKVFWNGTLCCWFGVLGFLSH